MGRFLLFLAVVVAFVGRRPACAGEDRARAIASADPAQACAALRDLTAPDAARRDVGEALLVRCGGGDHAVRQCAYEAARRHRTVIAPLALANLTAADHAVRYGSCAVFHALLDEARAHLATLVSAARDEPRQNCVGSVVERLRPLDRPQLEALLPLLHDTSERVRVLALGELRSAAEHKTDVSFALPAVLAHVEREADPMAQRDLLGILGALGPERAPTAARALTTLLRAGDSHVRTIALEALGPWLPDAGLEATIRGLLGDEDSSVRQTAAHLLVVAQIRRDPVVALRDANHDVRAQALRWLLEHEADVTPAVRAAAPPLLRDVSVRVRVGAAHLLLRDGAGGVAAQDVLLDGLRQGHEDRVRMDALVACRHVTGATATPALRQRLLTLARSVVPLERWGAVDALAAWRDPSPAVRSALRRALSDAVPHVAVAAALGLVRLGEPPALDTLRVAIEGPAPDGRLIALDALFEIGAAAAPLRSTLEGRLAHARGEEAQLLAELLAILTPPK